MARTIFLNVSTFQEETKLPRELAQKAMLAFHAHAEGREEFEDPFTEESVKVTQLNVPNYNTRGTDVIPGLRTVHRGLICECWYAGLTSSNKDYFKVRFRHPNLYPLDRNGSVVYDPAIVATGQIFVNKVNNDSEYKMQLRSMADAAQIRAAKKLLGEGVDTTTILRAMPEVTEQDLFGYQRVSRQSSVQLG